MPGEPVSRGPIESSSACASAPTCELSMPRDQIRLMIGSSEGKLWAQAEVAGARSKASRPSRIMRRIMALPVLKLNLPCARTSGAAAYAARDPPSG